MNYENYKFIGNISLDGGDFNIGVNEQSRSIGLSGKVYMYKVQEEIPIVEIRNQ